MDLQKYFAGGFEKRQAPSQFFTNLCTPVHTLTGTVKFDRRNVKRLIAVDVPACAGGRWHDLDAYDSLEYTIPMYNDGASLKESFFRKRPFGQHEYAGLVVNAVDKITRDQGILSSWQRMSQDKQVVDTLLNGKIKLINGDEIDYGKKATHTIQASAKFANAEAKPISTLEDAIQVILDDGKPGTTDFHYIVNSSDVNDFLSNEQVQKAAKKMDGIDRVAIGMPIEKSIGASLHGVFATGGCNVHLWGVNTKYDVPMGFGFAGEGTSQFLLPKSKSIVIPANPNFKMYYGGLMPCAPDKDPFALQPVQEEQLAYQYIVCEKGCSTVEYGVKMAPLFVPENGDDYSTIEGIS